MILADPNDPYRLTHETRRLGLVVCRGLQVSALTLPTRDRRSQVSLVCPNAGMEEIENPFVQPEPEI